MNILLTNDDGINSEGIQKLAEALRSRGNHKVTVVAPDTNRSGISHGLSVFFNPVKLSAKGEDAWACSGTPADCVIAALQGKFVLKPDLVISGINRGVNLGTDIVYSGTAAAARQASFAGIPALALSLESKGDYHWDMAASWSVDHLDELVAFWRKNTFVNVNIPNTAGGPEGIVATWPAMKKYNDKIELMEAPDGKIWCFLDIGPEFPAEEAGTDCDAVSRNFASVSTVYNFPVVLKDLCPGVPPYAAVAERDPKHK